ncbi:MAG: alpha/beta fold hydrolase [Acidobacteriaceae bacterium]|jgi:predicted alpha/beta-hydrolase family hydrolase
MGKSKGQEFRDDSPNEVPVRGFLHRPADSIGDCLVLAHGAGSNCNAPLLVALAEAFCSVGFTVLCCDLPFRQQRPHGPPPRGSAERDQQGLRAAVACMRRETSGSVFLGGHSYGGRQASMLASDEPSVADRLLLLSYPLHPPQRPAELRTAHFPRLQVPALFIHGTHDGFGSVYELAAALTLIPARTKLQEVAGAGHELLNQKNRDQLPVMIVGVFQSFDD